jgi:hypothetical protein
MWKFPFFKPKDVNDLWQVAAFPNTYPGSGYQISEAIKTNSSHGYIRWLQKKGFIHLASGAFSTVLGHPKSDRVIKVCHNPDAWIDYVYWGAKQGYAGRFVPKVYSFKKHPDFYVAVMEKLEYTASHADRKSEAYVANNLISLSLDCNNDTAKQLLDLIVPGMEAFSVAMKERFKGERLDIHGGNIMFRKDGGMVVVDPVCHEFSQHWVRLRESNFSPVTFH